MSSAGELVRWGLVPFVLGAAVALFLRYPSGDTAPDPRRESSLHTQLHPRSDSRASIPRDPAMSPPRGAESFECGELERQLAKLDGLVQEWFGDGEPWPDDSVSQLDEAGFVAWMEEVAREFPGTTVVEVDCSRYPCVGIWRVEELDAHTLFERGKGDLGDLTLSMRMLPIPDEQGSTAHWMVSAVAHAPGSVDRGLVSLRMNAALSASGWYGYENVDPDDEEAVIPFEEEL